MVEQMFPTLNRRYIKGKCGDKRVERNRAQGEGESGAYLFHRVGQTKAPQEAISIYVNFNLLLLSGGTSLCELCIRQ